MKRTPRPAPAHTRIEPADLAPGRPLRAALDSITDPDESRRQAAVTAILQNRSAKAIERIATALVRLVCLDEPEVAVLGATSLLTFRGHAVKPLLRFLLGSSPSYGRIRAARALTLLMPALHRTTRDNLWWLLCRLPTANLDPALVEAVEQAMAVAHQF
jgi:hypothetical protein